MDAAGLVTNTINSELPNRFDDDYVSEVCGGFYIDNFDTASVSDEETQKLYIYSQVPSLYSRVAFPYKSEHVARRILFLLRKQQRADGRTDPACLASMAT